MVHGTVIKRATAVLFSTLILASSARAADQSSGCGLGWYIFKDNSLVSSALRITTNDFLFNNTFGMTSGTSNCAKHSIIMNDKKSLHFVLANRDNLMIEAARGQGENLGALAATMGCGWQTMDRFGQAMRTHYQEIFPSDDAAAPDVLSHVATAIDNDSELAAGCMGA